MRIKLKWKAGGEGPLQPEKFENEAEAKERVKQLLTKYGDRVTCDVWNEQETWQIVAPPGLREWCGMAS